MTMTEPWELPDLSGFPRNGEVWGGSDPELEENLEGVAHDSIDLDETQGDDQYDDANSGADETLSGYGSATLLECLGRLGAQPNTTTPATCHSEGGKGEAPPNQTDPPQVMSQNLSQTLHQDSAPVHHPSPVNTHVQSVDHQHKKEETSETKHEELFDVKEEPESPG